MNSMNIHVSILSSVVFCCESETLHEMQCKGNNSCVLLLLKEKITQCSIGSTFYLINNIKINK